MQTNAEGLSLIKIFEGLRLKAYKDPVGILTIGYGHTYAAGAPEVKLGMVITREEAEAMLRRDLVMYEKAVADAVKVALTSNQNSACVSLCYNIGPGNFKKSSVLRFINQGRFDDAADAFLLWNRAGGKILSGLVKRRAAEAALFIKGSDNVDTPEEERATVEAATGKPSILSTTNVAAGVAAAATISASAKEIANNASAVFSGQNMIGVLAVVVLGALGWIVYQRYVHKRDWGI
jgi:lysozyme